MEALLPADGGRLDAVALFRAATFGAFARWFGLAESGSVQGRLAVWATRLFG